MKSKNLLCSFKYAIRGIYDSIKRERNMKIHITIAFLVCILGFYFKIRASEWLILIIWISLVLAAELINTSIEEAVNLASPQINEGARLSKDISAGAVLILATCAAISGCIIFIPKIISLLAK